MHFDVPRLGQKKVVLFLEIRRVKIFLSLTHPHSRTCVGIYTFNLKQKNSNNNNNNKKQEDKKKQKKLENKKNIGGKSNRLRCYRLRNHSICYTTTIYAVHTLKNKN